MSKANTTTATETETAATVETTTPKVTYVARAKALLGKVNKKKVAVAIVIALLLVGLILIGWQTGRELSAVKSTANQALAKATEVGDFAKSTDGVVVGLLGRVDTVEQLVAKVAGENQAQNQRLTAVEKTVADVGKTAIVAVAKADTASAKADTANARQNARVKAENQNYRKMLAFVRGAAPDSALAQKSNAEVEKLLNDGAWNIEGEIQSEYNRLNAQATATAQQTATATASKLEAVANTATQALAAGNTAISAVKVIADQPNKPLGKSVTTNSKKTLKELVAAYSK